MVYETLNFSEVWQSYDNFMEVKLNTNIDFSAVDNW